MTEAINSLTKIETDLENDPRLLYYFEQHQKERAKPSGRLTMGSTQRLLKLAYHFPVLRSIPGLSYLYHNVRSSTTGYGRNYEDLPFNTFPSTDLNVVQYITLREEIESSVKELNRKSA